MRESRDPQPEVEYWKTRIFAFVFGWQIVHWSEVDVETCKVTTAARRGTEGRHGICLRAMEASSLYRRVRVLFIADV